MSSHDKKEVEEVESQKMSSHDKKEVAEGACVNCAVFLFVILVFSIAALVL
ncbi:MAG: hypothetical protein HXY34_06795 [Candidatus Thorarchaeota archaeon]|nr:hypothetical protein [Candidatus Thorarchaeota archaeon]